MCLIKDYCYIFQCGLIEDCVFEYVIDFDKFNECVIKDDGVYGMGMFRSSVRRILVVGVMKSCIVCFNEEIYCVCDNGQWKECFYGFSVNDFVIVIEKFYYWCV